MLDDVVLLVEVHAVHAAGVAAQWAAAFRFAEENSLAFMAGKKNHLFSIREFRPMSSSFASRLMAMIPGRTRIGKFA